MAKKVAQLITISLTTRVVIEKNATDEQIARAAKPRFLAIINNNEILDNLVEITDDKECPFGKLNDIYFQPDMESDKYKELIRKKRASNIFSFQVFKDKALAQRVFPGVKIIEYSGDDIEEITFIDNDYNPKTGKLRKGLPTA